MNPDSLKALAGALIEKGAPQLGALIGGPAAGAALSFVLPKLAEAFGLAPGADASAITEAVQNAPDAAARLSPLEASKASQEYLDSQIAANKDLASIGDSFWSRFLVVGARPAMMWVAGPLMLVYEVLALRFGWHGLPMDFFVATQATFAGLAGVRTVEKWGGVDTKAILRK